MTRARGAGGGERSAAPRCSVNAATIKQRRCGQAIERHSWGPNEAEKFVGNDSHPVLSTLYLSTLRLSMGARAQESVGHTRRREHRVGCLHTGEPSRAKASSARLALTCGRCRPGWPARPHAPRPHSSAAGARCQCAEPLQLTLAGADATMNQENRGASFSKWHASPSATPPTWRCRAPLAPRSRRSL
jgi:hypothetical protein